MKKIKYLNKFKVLFIVLALMISTCSYANNDNNDSNEHKDKIERDDSTLFYDADISFANVNAVIESYQKQAFKKIIITSPGGDFDAAGKFAKFVTKNNISMFVPEYCASACTIPFLASSNKDIAKDATLFLHNVSLKVDADPNDKIKVKDAEYIAEETSTRSAIMMSFYAKAGIPPEILYDIAISHGQNGVELNRNDLITFGIIK